MGHRVKKCKYYNNIRFCAARRLRFGPSNGPPFSAPVQHFLKAFLTERAVRTVNVFVCKTVKSGQEMEIHRRPKVCDLHYVLKATFAALRA
jgi:hypothetical protein